MKECIVVVTFVLGVFGIIFGLVYWIDHRIENRPRAEPLYFEGNMVKFRAFDHIGMVIGGWCPKESDGGTCLYHVRFNALQLDTNTRFLGSDGPITFSPVTVVRNIKEYEIERAR